MWHAPSKGIRSHKQKAVVVEWTLLFGADNIEFVGFYRPCDCPRCESLCLAIGDQRIVDVSIALWIDMGQPVIR